MENAAVDSKNLTETQTDGHSCDTKQTSIKGSMQGLTKDPDKAGEKGWNSEKDKALLEGGICAGL